MPTVFGFDSEILYFYSVGIKIDGYANGYRLTLQ